MKTVTAHLKHIVGNYARAAVLGTAVITSAFLVPSAAHAQVFFSVNVAPPVIPAYDQPPCPGEGYIWTPGYWAYGDDGYYWVDGAWVEAPYEGALWTPGYWGYNNGAYLWNAGYWGNTVGYYGGIDYGFGYFGSGFYGGRWDRGHFFYNTAYNHIDGRRFHNIYDDRSHGGGTFVHPGGRAFDLHPRMDEHRGGGFNNNGFNQANRGNFNQQQNRGNFEQNRGNFDQNRGGFNQGIRNNDARGNDVRNNDNRGFMSQPQQQPRTNFEQPGRGAYNQDRGGFNQQPGNRPVYQGGYNQQRNVAPPQTQQYRQAYNGGNQNPGRSFEAPRQGFNQPQQQQPRSNMQAPPMQQQHFSQPAPQQARPPQSFNAPQQQHFSAPANNGGGGFHGGGGGEFHGGGRR